ncbi:MAG: peptide chain release factor N(5)-glutamine methyltransferase [Pseudomonadota bacterium]
MTAPDSITVGAWLRDLEGVPRLEGELLLGDALNCSRAHLLAHPEQTLTATQLNLLSEQLNQLRSGTPLAYIQGHREFWGLALNVDPSVLIPRPETELLVELALANSHQQAKVIELGTGSGAIAIALAHERQDLHVTAIDISASALTVARSNGEKHNVEIHWQISNWLQDVQGQFDLIIANPPYIAADDKHLPALAAEPQGALVSGADGLCDLGAIIRTAAKHLYPAGWCMLEHGYDQGPAVQALFRAAAFVNIQTHQDLAGLDRVTIAQTPQRSEV